MTVEVGGEGVEDVDLDGAGGVAVIGVVAYAEDGGVESWLRGRGGVCSDGGGCG